MESASPPDRASGGDSRTRDRLKASLLGPMRLSDKGVDIALPGSRKVRGLMAYLLMARRPLHRSRLCEIFWDGPNDPRGELRWCLSKIRGVLDDRHGRRLQADGDFVAIDLSSVDVDALALDRAAEATLAGFDVPRLETLAGVIEGDFLDGLTLEQLPLFESWLTAERERYRTLNARLLSRMIELLPLGSEKRFSKLRRQIELRPYEEAGHRDLLVSLAAAGRFAEGDAHLALATRLLKGGGAHPGALEEDWRSTKLRHLRDAPLPPPLPIPDIIRAADSMSAPQAPLGASGARIALAALQPRDTPAPKLPPHLSSYIGRGDEEAEVKARLSLSRLVTLVGAGGCGKTRLALNVARGFSDQNIEAVWLVELAALVEPQLVGEVLCQSIGLPVNGSGSAVDQASVYLRNRKALIVLDNCEHMIDAAATLTAALLGSCRDVLILATSRQTLNVPGESVYPVPGLSLPTATAPLTLHVARQHDAIKLFEERARAVAQDFALSDGNVDAVGDICRQLDGLPLGIELVVPQLRMMQPHGLAARLHDRVLLNVTGERGVQPRHRTLEAMFDWSYNLLSVAERALFCRLAVFNDGWTLPAAAAVAGETLKDGELSDVLRRLVDKSLVVTSLHNREFRYTYLQTTRQYALARLSESGAIAFRRRLALYMTQLFERADAAWPTTPTALWLATVEPDLDNLRASLDWAFGPEGDAHLGVRLCAFSRRLWDELALLSERERWFALAAARHDQLTPPSVAARLWLGRLSNSGHGDHSNFALARQAADLFRAAGDDLGVGEAFAKAGAALERPDTTGDALPYLEEALRVLSPAGPTKPLAGCLRSLAIAHYFDRDFETARTLLGQSELTAKAVGDARGVATVQIAAGELAFAAGNTDEAIAEITAMLAGDHYTRRQMVLGLTNLAAYLLACGRVAEGRLAARRALVDARALDWRAAIVRVVEHIGLIAALSGDSETAAKMLGHTAAFLCDRDRQSRAYGDRDLRAFVEPSHPRPAAGPFGSAYARGSTMAVRRSGPAGDDGGR